MPEGKESEAMSSQYITASEVSELLGVSLAKSYSIIRSLNAELKSKGYLVIAGKVSRAYFAEKWYGMGKAGETP